MAEFASRFYGKDQQMDLSETDRRRPPALNIGVIVEPSRAPITERGDDGGSTASTFGSPLALGSTLLGPEAIRLVLEQNARHLASHPGGMLKTRMKLILNRMTVPGGIREAESIFQSQRPVALLLQRKWFQLALLLLFILWTFNIQATASNHRQGWVHSHTHFRFSPLKLRNGQIPTGRVIEDFNILLNGCVIPASDSKPTTDGPRVVKSFSLPVDMNGFAFTASPEASQPVAFQLEGSDDLEAWAVVGSAAWRYSAELELQLLDGEGPGPATDENGETVVDMRAPFPLVLFRLGVGCARAALLASALLLVVMGKAWHGSVVIISSFLVAAVIEGGVAVTLIVKGRLADSVQPLCWTLFDAVMAPGLSLNMPGRRLVELAMTAALLLLAPVFELAARPSAPRSQIWLEMPVGAACMVALGFVMFGMKRRRLLSSRRGLHADQAKYDAAWAEAIEADGEREAMTQASNLLAKMRRAASRQPPRHTLRSHPKSTAGPRSTSTNMSSTETATFLQPYEVAEPVRDLDQVYRQACVLSGFAQSKVWQWATASGGFLPTRDLTVTRPPVCEESGRRRVGSAGAGGVSWAWKRSTELGGMEAVAWPDLKDSSRAMVKVLQAYAGDASKLLDVCRHRVAFDSLRSLHQCLRRLELDADIVVHRVKDGLSSGVSGGFRAVVLSVSIRTQETLRLSLDLHLFELQLMLLPIAHVQASANHALYLDFRNSRALSETRVERFLHRILRRRRSSALIPPSLRHIFSPPSNTRVHPLSVPHDSFASSVEPLPHRGSLLGSKRPSYREARAIQQQQRVHRAEHMSPATLSPSPLTANPSPSSIAASPTAHFALQSIRPAPISLVALEHRSLSPLPPPQASDSQTLVTSIRSGVSAVSDLEEGREGGGRRASLTASQSTHMRKMFGGTWGGGAMEAAGGLRRHVLAWTQTLHSVDGIGRGGRRREEAAAQEEAAEGGQSGTMDAVLEEMLLSAVTAPGGRLDKRVRRFAHEALRHVKVVSSFFTASPIVSVISFRWLRVGLLLVALLYLAKAVPSASLLIAQRSDTFSALRFELISTNASLDLHHALTVGLLLDECEVAADGVQVDASAVTLHWDRPARADGWFVKVDDTSVQAETFAVWVVRGEEKEGWECLRMGRRIERECESRWGDDDDDREEGGGKGGGGRRVLLRAWWGHYLLWLIAPLVKAAGFAAAAILGMLRRERGGQLALLAPHAVLGACLLLAGATHVSQWERSAFWLGEGAVAVVTALLGGVVSPRCLVATLGIASAVNAGITRLAWEYDGAIQHHGSGGWVVTAFAADGFVCAACVALLVLRWRVLAASRELIDKDKRRYDEEWELVKRDQLDALHDLKLKVSRLTIASIRPLQLAPAASFSARPSSLSTSAVASLTEMVMNRIKGPAPVASTDSKGSSSSSERDPHDHHGHAGPAQPHSGGSWERRGSLDSSRDTVEADGSSAAAMSVSRDRHVLVPVRSLDQLFAQAKVVQVCLRAKVQAWAEASGGWFNARRAGEGGEPRFVEWSAAKDDEAMRREIKWGSVKSEHRAIEKQLRSYQGECGRLVDVCRECIMLPSVEGVVRCLDAIERDSEAVLVRAKNRLDLDFDSAYSAGYRDVALNLCLSSELTRSLHVHRHVCEVQLILLPFARLKSDEGHKRYVQFRNARAE